MNPFKVGDRVRCENAEYIDMHGREFIVTCVDDDCIGFVSDYPIGDNDFYKKVREGTEAGWFTWKFKLVQSAEDIEFNNQLKDIVNESV